MTLDYTIALDRIAAAINAELSVIKSELEDLPDGRLMISQEKSRTVFYISFTQDGKRRKRMVSHNSKDVQLYARKEYLHIMTVKLLKDAELLKATANGFRENELNNVYGLLPKHFELLPAQLLLTPSNSVQNLPNPTFDHSVPIRQLCTQLYNVTPQEWMGMRYRQNAKDVERKNCRAENGLLLRSKGELEWANLLNKYGLPYHYDELMAFLREWISPDFVVLRFDGKLIFIEHCGLVTNADYMEHFFEKLRIYRKAGIVPGDNLIVAFDHPSGGIDVELMKAELRSKMLIA